MSKAVKEEEEARYKLALEEGTSIYNANQNKPTRGEGKKMSYIQITDSMNKKYNLTGKKKVTKRSIPPYKRQKMSK